MERDVRYCTTSDGVNIAYCIEGDGSTAIVALPALIESFSLDHMMPVYKQFYADLGEGRRVVRFDWRGTGLSSSPPHETAFTLDSFDEDILAVVQAVGDPVLVWAPTVSGIRALRFTVAHPELVSHLVFYGSFVRLSDALSIDMLDGINNLIRADWRMAAQTIADTNGRREYPEEAAELGEWYHQSVSQEAYIRMARAAYEEANRGDFAPLLSQVAVPTLVLHRLADPIIKVSAGQRIAAGIPGARFVPLEGKGHLFCLGDYSRILSSVDALIGDRADEQTATRLESSAFRTVLFTDIVGHTEMMSRLGDERGRDVLRDHERLTREVLAAHGGSEVKTMGDGFMASFGSVTKAVECAIALQRAFTERDGEPLDVRVGLNAGEPIEEDGDLFGATVILASRIAGKADGGEILTSDNVRSLSAGKGFLFSDRGDFVAKGFEEPVRVYEVSWRI